MTEATDYAMTDYAMEQDISMWHDPIPMAENVNSTKKRTLSFLLNGGDELLSEPEAPTPRLETELTTADTPETILIGAVSTACVVLGTFN
jgi:hypothetical protein